MGIGQLVYANDPHVMITVNNGNETRHFSGTFIDDDKIITCWHGIDGISNPRIVVSTLQKSATAKIVVFDSDKDILLLETKEFDDIDPIELGKGSLLPDTICEAHGFVLSEKKLNRARVIGYNEFRTIKGAQILNVSAPVVSGMSGGGLLYNGKLYGVQSSGKDNKVSYCPSYQIIEFIK